MAIVRVSIVIDVRLLYSRVPLVGAMVVIVVMVELVVVND